MRIENNCIVVWNTKAVEVSIPFDEISLVGIPHNEKLVDLFHGKNDEYWCFLYMLTKAKAKELKLHYWGETRKHKGCETYVIVTSSPWEYTTDKDSELIPVTHEKITTVWEAVRDYKRAKYSDNSSPVR